jgi:DNA-binding IclR family transcriptional regulator
MIRKNNKRTDLDYTVEKTVQTMKILEVLEIAPASVTEIIKRVGDIPNLKNQLQTDSANRILKTLKILGYANEDTTNKTWSKGYKAV